MELEWKLKMKEPNTLLMKSGSFLDSHLVVVVSPGTVELDD